MAASKRATSSPFHRSVSQGRQAGTGRAGAQDEHADANSAAPSPAESLAETSADVGHPASDGAPVSTPTGAAAPSRDAAGAATSSHSGTLYVAAALSAVWVAIVIAAAVALFGNGIWQGLSIAGWASVATAATAPLCLVWLVTLALILARLPRTAHTPQLQQAALDSALQDTAARLQADLERMDGAVTVIAGRARDCSNKVVEDVGRLVEQASRLDETSTRISTSLQASTTASAASLKSIEDKGTQLTEQIAQAARQADPLAARLEAFATSLNTVEQQIIHAHSLAQDRTNAMRTSLASLQDQQTALASLARELDSEAERIAATLETRGVSLQQTAGRLAQEAERTAGALETAASHASTRIAECLDAMAATLEQTERAAHAQTEALETVLEQWQTRSRDSMAGHFAEFDRHLDASAERVSGVLAPIAGDPAELVALETRVAALAEQTGALLSGSFNRLEDGARTVRDLLGEGAERADALAGPTEALSSTSRALHDTLAAAAGKLADLQDLIAQDVQQHLEGTSQSMQQRTAQLNDLIDRLQATRDQLSGLEESVSSGLGRLDQMADTIARQREGLSALTGQQVDMERLVAATAQEAQNKADAVAMSISTALVESMGRVRAAAAKAQDVAEEAARTMASTLGAQLEQVDFTPLRERLVAPLESALEELRKAGELTSLSARSTLSEFESRLAELDARSAQVREQVEQARSLTRQASSNAFNRISKQLIESLNSASIDISKLMSQDIPDTDWDAYLNGDRSIFTRRAARLTGRGTRAQINRHYEEDQEFREQVRRFVKDFERLMAHGLDQPDGEMLSITLISSDLGKLYVSLAQSIKRLQG